MIVLIEFNFLKSNIHFITKDQKINREDFTFHANLQYNGNKFISLLQFINTNVVDFEGTSLKEETVLKSYFGKMNTSILNFAEKKRIDLLNCKWIITVKKKHFKA